MNLNVQIFSLSASQMRFDMEKSLLLCRDLEGKKTFWIKKLNEISRISGVIEDGDRYFLSCEMEGTTGRFIALFREDGKTAWFIPGRSFLQVFHKNFLYIIFIDSEEDYYLLKTETRNGETVWHHKVESDLCQYSIGDERIVLVYGSGKTEELRSDTGKPVLAPLRR
jgi:hypothetical protein